MRGGVLALGLLSAVLLISLDRGAGKRFDCRVFCKSTGFSGMIGGCRCSFTLFTSKRSGPGSRGENPAETGPELYQLPPPAVGQHDLHVLIPYTLFRNSRNTGQKEIVQNTDFEGKDDLVFGNMYQ